MPARRRLFLAPLLGWALAAAAMVTCAQTAAPPYPNKPIKLLVGVPPGGSTDALARLIADWLRESLGQPTIVENRPGANTAVAADAVARSTPDGHTLLVATDAFITVSLLARVGFDPFKDFVPVATVAANRFVMVVHPSVPAGTLQEFIAYAKSRPGQLSYGSSGNGGTSHLAIEKFKMLTATHIVHIPYRGAGPALTDAIGGQVQLSMWTPLAVSAHVAAGKLKPLALTGPGRLPVLAQVPTFAEAGLPAYDYKAWLAVFAPAGTPKPIVDRLNIEMQKMLADPKVRQTFDRQGVEPFYATSEQVATFMRSQMAEIEKLVKAANVKMD
jgi:tripartite-type tricarboxylate transporter receptor subunit TctC